MTYNLKEHIRKRNIHLKGENNMQKWKYFNEAEFIYKGDWNDPQLKYKGKIFNYYRIEDAIYHHFKEFAEEHNIEVNDKNFEEFCKENQEYIRETFDEILEYELKVG